MSIQCLNSTADTFTPNKRPSSVLPYTHCMKDAPSLKPQGKFSGEQTFLYVIKDNKPVIKVLAADP